MRVSSLSLMASPCVLTSTVMISSLLAFERMLQGSFPIFSFIALLVSQGLVFRLVPFGHSMSNFLWVMGVLVDSQDESKPVDYVEDKEENRE